MTFPARLLLQHSSSRFTEKNIWVDPKLSLSYNVQVEIPVNEMTDINDIKEIPVTANAPRPVLGMWQL
jgi:hypothetical protein